MYKTITVTLKGLRPLMTHDAQLVDPLNNWTRELKKVTGRRKKSDDDLLEMSRLEFHGGLWLDEDGEPCLKAEAVQKAIIEGARKTKQGKIAESAVLVPVDAKLEYDGPKDPTAMWEDGRYVDRRRVVVSRASVMRTRPKFPWWQAKVAIDVDTGQTNVEDVLQWLNTAGHVVGIGDYRPRFGRFVVEA